jgi:hypothetical protein
MTRRLLRRAAGGVALVAALPLVPHRAAAQGVVRIPVQAGATLDRDSVTVGDVVTLTVRIRAPHGATINFPVAVDSLGPVQSLTPPTVRDGTDTLEYADRIATYTLAPWDVGRLPIRLGDVLVQTDDDERRVALPLPSLFVRSVLPADSAQRIPKPARPLLEPRAALPWWWWALAALALALGVAIWWWVRRRSEATRLTGDPYADAERAFARIEKMHLVEAGEPGRHVALMTDVVRRYLAGRLPGASLAQTSSEFLAAVRGTRTLSHERLEHLLTAVEPVKFAAAPVAAERARALGMAARGIVRPEHEHAAALAAAAAAPQRGVAA